MANETAWEGAESTIKYVVQLGTWINWSRGRIMGSTLTLDRSDGNFVLTFTSLFIAIVSSCFWHIVRVLMHRYYSMSAPRNALHHQRQAVLRNSSSAFSSFLVLCSLAWAWRHTVEGRRCLFRLGPGILTAAFVALAFGIASGFSSQISSLMGRQVLLDGKNCSIVDGSNMSNFFDRFSYISRVSVDDANYARQCYSNEPSGMFDCNSFVKPRLPSTVDTHAPCPFAHDLCRSSDGNIRLDTGYLDSNDDLGMNAPKDERILFRTVLSCAPLITSGYTTNITTEKGTYTTYNYGNRIYNTDIKNYTHRVRSIEEQYAIENSEKPTFLLVAYEELNYNGSASHPVSHLAATPGLFPHDGDLVFAFLSGNGVNFFFTPMNDLWYRATSQVAPDDAAYLTADIYPNLTANIYHSDEAASPLACFQQYQFCDASEARCGPLSSLMDAQAGAAEIFGTTAEVMINNEMPPPDNPKASRYIWFVALLAMAVPRLSFIIDQPDAKSLQSISRLRMGFVSPLPINQWQIDVTHWWATYLAGLQSGVVSTSYGITDPSMQSFKRGAFNDWIQDHVCSNQLILSSDYISFSLFGLYFIYITGAIIIIISFSLEAILSILYRRRQGDEYAYLEWTSTETLQLQRMAFQGVKSGTWSGYTHAVPITLTSSETMTSLALKYPITQDPSENASRGQEKTSGENQQEPWTTTTSPAMTEDITPAPRQQTGTTNTSRRSAEALDEIWDEDSKQVLGDVSPTLPQSRAPSPTETLAWGKL